MSHVGGGGETDAMLVNVSWLFSVDFLSTSSSGMLETPNVCSNW